MSRRRICVVGAMLERESGVYLITQRLPTAIHPLLWEFPGGKVEKNETKEAALQREIQERLGVQIEVLEQATHTENEYPEYTLEFSVFRCALANTTTPLRALRAHDFRWVTLEEMEHFQFPAADANTLAQLLELEG
jgi:8-oxo-dGTP diphosphatase